MEILLKSELPVIPPPTIVRTKDEVGQCLALLEASRYIALDTETTGLDIVRDRVVYWSLAAGDGDNRYVLPLHVLPHFRKFLERPDIQLLFWNESFDRHMMKNHGVFIRTPRTHDGMVLSWHLRKEDRESHSLKFQGKKRGYPMKEFNEVFPTGSILDYSIEETADYASLDAFVTYHVTIEFIETARKTKAHSIWGGTILDLYRRVNRPAIRAMWRMSRRGVLVNQDFLSAKSREAEHRMDEIEIYFTQKLGRLVNLGSHPQVAEILYDYNTGYGLPAFRQTDGGKPSTDAEALEELLDYGATGILEKTGQDPNELEARKFLDEGIEAVKLVLEYRKLEKTVGTYLGYEPGSRRFAKKEEAKAKKPKSGRAAKPVRNGLRGWCDRNGRVHTSMGVLINTARTNSWDPNLQQIPSNAKVDIYKLRRGFIATPGYVLCASDYSQIELRILAHYSRDKNLIMAFREGKDVHAYCASLMFGVDYDAVMRAKKWRVDRDGPMTPEVEHLRWLRHAIKTISFAMVYGASKYRIAQELSSMGQSKEPDEAQELMDAYFGRFPGVPAFMQESIDFARKHGYVTTLLGHVRHLPEIRAGDFRSRKHAERCATNTSIQGSACDVMKLSMSALDTSRELSALGVHMILQVHDEILFEIPEMNVEPAVSHILRIMDNPGINLRVPMVAEAGVGSSWYDAKNAA